MSDRARPGHVRLRLRAPQLEPRAYGAYPFIDWDRQYFGLLARQGRLGTFRDGDVLFEVIAADAGHWANLCR